jgi:hypothetical protein
MGVITRKFPNQIDSIVTESYVYVAVDLLTDEAVKRVKVQRSLWDTGASVSLISSRVVKVLGLNSIGKSGVSGYNEGVDVKDTYLVHIGLPTGDIVTNIMAMEFDSDEYDVVIGMDVICKGDLAVTNYNNQTTFSFRIPSNEEIDFSIEK